ncbi:flagellar biosynthesis repressor FlbT [Psychromarinibacter halotolerans]|uniref:Flagellar biosynthesis repressor FlbT n=1 Tax=Psychromarinibacter halotolerans TaxID=1775175 RepID=A0ABV7GMN4_9RHOB|nr:flagellar biosynthesis repressor FlbT [Psychromarinibacter halotolerans]MAQ86024.1 hypothetical protein [Maritimibacter sp.]MDF0595792.1 flagellar biosynthesis repressor FlbT [Psychromarinibacter halotolerans]
MGLILKVKTGDRIVINGAVLRNAGKGQMFVEVENRSDVLRGEEILAEDKAQTPVRRLCQLIQVAMVSRESRGEILPRIHDGITELMQVMQKSHGKVLDRVRSHVEQDNLYGAYRVLGPVIRYEDKLLAISAGLADTPKESHA